MTTALQGRKRGRLEVSGRQKSAVEQGLAQAFVTFTQAASSLERSYTLLQNEVGRLHDELSRTNAQLDRSLDENARMRVYLAQVLENLPCGVIVAGGEGTKIQVINPEARRLLQLPPGWQAQEGANTPELLEKLLAQDTGKDARKEVTAETEQFGRRSIGISQSNLAGKNGDGGDRIWILRDITEEKRLAAEKEASRRSQALAEIATLLAHEIRNPLGSMELFAGLLAEAAASTPETRQWVNHLQAGLRSLSATVNNVLQFHAQAAVQLVPTDVERVLSEVTEFLQPLAKQRGQQLKFENTIGKVWVQADGNRLKQVFLNLAMNGFRAMPPGGTLHAKISWAPQFPGGLVLVEVHDEGRGIPAELLGKIFDAGFTTTPGSPGLGLAVCQKIVEQHGGQIDVQSRVKEGTRFRILFPVAGGQP